MMTRLMIVLKGYINLSLQESMKGIELKAMMDLAVVDHKNKNNISL